MTPLGTFLTALGTLAFAWALRGLCRYYGGA